MKSKLHVDIETYSSVDIMSSGVYKYVESLDFEILMVAYAFDNEPVQMVDLLSGQKLPARFINALIDPNVEKWAHNANFERQAFRIHGYNIPTEQMYCTAIKAAYSGLPLSLDAVSKALDLGEKAKAASGKALIRYFSCPVKPTKVNGDRCRNFPGDSIENAIKWEEYKQYCVQDVIAEREIDELLKDIIIPDYERECYLLDQEINDCGILIDLEMAANAVQIDAKYSKELLARAVELTSLDNPKSPAQLKQWLGAKLGRPITSLNKADIPDLIDEAGEGPVAELLGIRQKLSKTSTKKYVAMLECATDDKRAHGLFQHYGANRTGRCLAKGSKVLVNVKGKISEVPIEKVTTEMLVFDGDNWVEHEGVECNGRKWVVEHDGVTATLKHKVFIGSDTVMTLKEAKLKNLKLWQGNNTEYIK